MVSQENKKPEPVSTPESKREIENRPAGAQPTAISLALKQAGEEAAQKAKDLKKKGMQTFSGVGKADPVKDNANTTKDTEVATSPKEKTIAVPTPLNLADRTNDRDIDLRSSLQSPASSSWTIAPNVNTPMSPQNHSIDTLASLQSPNSTAWKPANFPTPISQHRGSSISQASEEDIKRIEKEQAIKEEEEESDDEDDGDDSDEESSSDEEEKSPRKAIPIRTNAPEQKKVVAEDTSESSDSSEEESDDEEDEQQAAAKEKVASPASKVTSPTTPKPTVSQAGHETSDSSESSDEEARAPVTKPVATTASTT